MKVIPVAVALLFLFLATAQSSLAKNPTLKGKTGGFVITAYYKPNPNQKKFATGSYKGDLRLNGTGRTFSGKEAKEGYAAADLAVLPLGTLVSIPGHKVVQIEDTGGDIKGKRIDIFMGEGDLGLARALEWGKKKLTIEVLKKGDH